VDLVVISIGLGLLAIVYGIVTSRQVLKQSAGNAKMQEIAGAIQEGAQAYLKRQYTTIGMVGVVVAVLVWVFLDRMGAPRRFCRRAFTQLTKPASPGASRSASSA